MTLSSSLRKAAALGCGSALLVAACSSGAGAPSATPSVSKRDVDIEVLVTRSEPDGTTSGDTSSVTVSVEPSDGEFKLASIESGVHGTGDQWTASEWAGSAAALMLTGYNPKDVKTTFDVEGVIDGPSAGAIMTVAVAAALNGDELRPGVSMTGTINPDGTIGPVGGIPHKIEGAKESGLSTVVVPAGSSPMEDSNTGELVDLAALGQQLGIDVVEAATVTEAYTTFTGQELSDLPPPVTQYTFSDEAATVMNIKVDEWLATYENLASQNAARHQKTAKKFGVEYFSAIAAQNAELARKYQSDGLPAAAYDAATYAAYLEVQVNQLGRAAAAAAKGGSTGLQQFIDESNSIGVRTEEVLDQFLGITPQDVSDIGWLTGAYSFLLDGLGRSLSAQQELEQASDDPMKTVQTVIERDAQAEVLLAVAQDMLEMGVGEPGASLSGEDVSAYTDFFDDAAAANLALFEATVVAEVAEQTGVSESKAKTGFAEKDADYENVLLSDRVISILEQQGEDRPSFQYAKLGAALNRFVTSASLIAKFYSLDAQLDPETFAVTDLPVTPKVEAMLSASEDQVLRGVALLEQNQVDTTPVTMLYEMAIYETDEAVQNNDSWLLLTGLSSMWQAQLLTDIMATYGGFARSR